jgi:hypothetical protein
MGLTVTNPSYALLFWDDFFVLHFSEYTVGERFTTREIRDTLRSYFTKMSASLNKTSPPLSRLYAAFATFTREFIW